MISDFGVSMTICFNNDEFSIRLEEAKKNTRNESAYHYQRQAETEADQ